MRGVTGQPVTVDTYLASISIGPHTLHGGEEDFACLGIHVHCSYLSQGPVVGRASQTGTRHKRRIFR